jgi:uncharacterized cupredoxin-like copper-binding protein
LLHRQQRRGATHEFFIEATGAIDRPLHSANGESAVEDIAPGQTKDLLWTFSDPGPYQLACHVPGHFETRMKATFDAAP